jgi:putative transposase
MPWDDITRQQHRRDNLRYPGDLTEAEWGLVAPFIPPAKPGGRPRTAGMRGCAIRGRNEIARSRFAA